MVERICPACQHANPIENRFCGACGASLERHELARRDDATIVIAGQRIPLAQVRQVSKAVAVGLAAVAAEAGIAWLKRRAEQGGLAAAASTALAASQQPARQLIPIDDRSAANVVTIVSQRVVEVWEHGSLARQIIEKHVWKREG